MTAINVRALAEPPTKTPVMRRDAVNDEIGPNKLYNI
jgi:hypothetical protein